MGKQFESTAGGWSGIEVRDTTLGNMTHETGFRPIMNAMGNRFSKINFNSVARILSIFSLGLGLVQLFAPRRIQRLVGVRDEHFGLIRLMGMREIMHALLIFMQARPTKGMWSRVAGDVVDLSFLGSAFSSRKNKRDHLTGVTAVLAGITALDLLTATQLSRKQAEERSISTLTRADLNRRTDGRAFHADSQHNHQ